MSKFTKGPWFVDSYEIKAPCCPIELAKVTVFNEGKANANLIAAAPDMRNDLELLRDHLAFIKGDDYELVVQADKTLAKADGKGE